MSKITIAGYEFEVPSPYEIGHKCTAAEAAALNSRLHENISRNFRRRVVQTTPDMCSAHGPVVGSFSERKLAYLQAELDDYCAAYSLNGSDPILEEAKTIALQIVKVQLKARKLNVSDFSKADLTREAEKLLDVRQNSITFGEIMTMARERVEQYQRAAKKEMERMADARP